MLRTAVEELGRPDFVNAFEQLQDPAAWTRYAVEQINRVQQRAAKLYPDLHIHSWPDRLLVERTSGELSDRLQAMREAVSPESFGSWQPEPQSTQSALFKSAAERGGLL